MTEAELKQRKVRARIVLRKLKQLYPNIKPSLFYKTNWQALVSVILSAQCTDKKVNEVTKQLFKDYPKVSDYLKMSKPELEKYIKQTGFFRNKAKHILGAARIINEEHGGRVPKTMEDMLKLPGVARKTANIVLYLAHGVISGVPVDTHVRRLSRKFGLTDHTDPKKIEKDLIELLPKKDWVTTTFRLVEYGREYSPARKVHSKDDPISKLL